MSMPAGSLLDTIRKPEYTGSNRCAPCTVFNSLIAIGLAAAIAVLLAPAVGLALLVVAAGSIYFRGYLVPGTPTLTKRYAPEFVLGAFGKAPTRATANGEHPGADLESVLLEAGVVTECEAGTDLCLEADFQAALHRRMDDIDAPETSRELVSSLLDVDPDNVEYRSPSGAFIVLADGKQVGTWPSEAAFAADLASADLLPAWMDHWDALPASRQAGLTSGLRLFLEECPSCGGDLQMTEEIVESCCREFPVVALECPDCGARLFEVERPEADGTDASMAR